MIPRGSERVGYLPKGIQLISSRIEESISSVYAPMGPLFPKFQLPLLAFPGQAPSILLLDSKP